MPTLHMEVLRKSCYLTKAKPSKDGDAKSPVYGACTYDSGIA
jgi:hypothetical protein